MDTIQLTMDILHLTATRLTITTDTTGTIQIIILPSPTLQFLATLMLTVRPILTVSPILTVPLPLLTQPAARFVTAIQLAMTK